MPSRREPATPRTAGCWAWHGAAATTAFGQKRLLVEALAMATQHGLTDSDRAIVRARGSKGRSTRVVERMADGRCCRQR
eukprot:5909739-Prymnesium_polylepis.1